jgi:hypothetical protein
MKDKEPTHVTDNLLRSIFTEDLPPETERVMRERFVRFREDLGHTGCRRTKWFPLQRAFAREALALASVVLVSVGAFLHAGGHRSAMADTLSFLHLSVTVSERVLRAASMECKARVRSENGRSLNYTIRWLGPNRSRIDVHDGSVLVETYTSSQGFPLDDPLLEPVTDFLAPDTLSDAIYEKWRPKTFGMRIGEKTQTLIYVNGHGETLLEMDIDLTTYLPRRVKKDVVEARFTWNESVPSEEGS